MASFDKGGTLKTPFGKNSYLRHTAGLRTESYTFAAATMPYVTIDGIPQRILQPGTVLAKITTGPDAGKVGVFQGVGTAEEQTLTEGTAITAGTYTITFNGQTTAPIAYNATAATIQAALEALSNIAVGDVEVTGGPVDTAVVTIKFLGTLTGNVSQVTVDVTALTGTITVATSVAGVAGAADGRGATANIVGLCDTFLPWQLLERDVEVAAVYNCTAVQSWCFEYNAAGVAIALTNTTADAMRGTKGLDVTFK